MGKTKVYELAKELGVSSKEMLDLLQKKNIEVKSHMSVLEDAVADAIRGDFRKTEGGSASETKTEMKPEVKPETKPEAKAEAKPEEKPEAKEGAAPVQKKKNLVHVFRPQNTRDGARNARRNNNNNNYNNRNQDRTGDRGGMRNQQGRNPQGRQPQQQTGSGRPDRTSYMQRPAQQALRLSTQRVAEAEKRNAALEREAKEAAQAAALAEKQRLAREKEEMKLAQKEAEKAAEMQAAKEAEVTETQTKEGKSQEPAQQRPQRQARPEGQRGQNSQGGERRGNDRPGTGRTDRPMRGDQRADRRNDRPGTDRNGERPQRPFGGNKTDRGPARDGGRDAARPGDRRPGSRNDRRSTPAASMESTQKPQQRKGYGKDDYKKKDYRHDEDDNMMKGGKGKSGSKQKSQVKPLQKPQKVIEEIKSIIIPESLTIQELADHMKKAPAVIIKKLFMQGKIVTVNQEIDYETAEEIALEFDILCEKEVVVDVIEELLKEEEEDEKKMKDRAPVVCVMGHVDHGKTSLLDAIRHTNVIGGEAGGITQHIGASVVEINGQKITFLDTPGHEAFTSMRMRGANSTDIAILVVAADDGVMPQTVEAINHAKAAGVEIIVAVNKIDKPEANVERVKQEMTEYELIAEDWGGSTPFVPVSAKTREGLDDLLEMILLTAEVMELKANPNRRARGLVLEAQLDKGRGPVATVLVQKGTLRVGDAVAAGSCFGKVRAMMDDKGRRVKEAGPSTPVEILGLNDVPSAGEVLMGCKNDKDARSFAETFITQGRQKLLEETKQKLSLDDLFTQIKEGNLKELNIVVKADVQGSVEAMKQSLVKLSNDEVVVKIIHGAVGAVNESDVMLASASNAIIIGFNVRPDAMAKESAEREGVDLRLYRVIYNAIEDVEAAMKGMLDPIFEEKVLGHAEVRQTFKASGVGTIAGSYVQDGVFERDCAARIVRDGIVIYDGSLASLKRFKDDVKEVRAGYECGFVFTNYNDVKEGDHVEAYKMVEIPR